MKRIESLIEKLNLQVKTKASPNQLLVTLQMLQKEITGSMKDIEVLGTSGISVIAPVASPKSSEDVKVKRTHQSDKEYFELVVENAENEEPAQETTVTGTIPNYEEAVQMQQQAKSKLQPALPFKERAHMVSDELPTLSRQPKLSVKASKQSSSPKSSRNSIKDLKKGINSQDRLLYIKELFRGDENMFERSIRTINNFGSLAEAEYWIRRELKTMNGWLPGNPVAQQSEVLIKKRFA